MSVDEKSKKCCDCEACENRKEAGCPNSPSVTVDGKDYCDLCAPKVPVTRWTPEERGFIISYVHAINELAERQQASVGQYQECKGGDGIILLDIHKFGDGGHGTVEGVRLRDYFLQSTTAVVDSPVTNLPKILQAVKDGKHIVDAVMAYDKCPVVTSEQPTGFVPTPDELAVLVKHWVNQAINNEYFIFWGQCVGSSDVLRINFDWERINEIGKMLGDELTHTAVEEAFLQASQDFNRNHWIVFHYGTEGEINAYREMGGQCLDKFPDGVADRLASQVAERVFREEPEERQMSLIKTELKRYSTKLRAVKDRSGHLIQMFGIYFPAELTRLVLGVGVEDADSQGMSNTLTLDQGKAILAALDETARKGESALKELVAEPESVVNALGPHCCTPEEVVRFLNEPLEDSDEAA